MTIKASELILNADGSIYHLGLQPDELGETVITVGDPDRVAMVSKHFDRISVKKHNREFVTHTGMLNGKTISCISTGIGTDNVDIALNEIDALVNIDLRRREIKSNSRSLTIIRLGTCGSLQSEIDVDDFIVTEFAMGFDSLMAFYQRPLSNEESQLTTIAQQYFAKEIVQPYVCQGDKALIDRFKQHCFSGITASCCGFYGPQGRQLRGRLASQYFVDALQNFSYQQLKICNFEMETAGIYGLGRVLNHHCCSVSVVVANRVQGTFSQSVDVAVEKLIKYVLSNIKSF